MLKKTILSLSVCGLLAGAQTSMAYEQGDFIVRGGAALVDPDESAGPIVVDTLGLGPAGSASVGVNSDTQLGLTFSYMLQDNLSIELLAATPFTHDIYGDGVIRGIGNLAETSHLPPTLTLNYHFMDASSKFQPYIGAGINYTIFFDEDVTSTLNNEATMDALVNLAAGTSGVDYFSDVSGTDIDLDDSVGLAIHLGFDYQITDNLGVNAAYWNINIDTEAEITATGTNNAAGPLGAGTTAIKAHVDVDIDPSVYMVGLTYKF